MPADLPDVPPVVPDTHLSASQWLSSTTAQVLDRYTSRLAQEDDPMTAAARPRPLFLKRAVGIIRVSEVGDREGERFVSPRDQRKAITRICEAESLRLVDIFEELDISAYRRTLDRRPGLGAAVAMIEHGQADVVVACYFDRLFRKLTVQEEASAVSRTPAGGCWPSTPARSAPTRPRAG